MLRICRPLAVAIALVATGFGYVTTAAAEPTPTRPNILLVVADDQAYSTFNRALMPTVFSQIVDQGVLFDRHYVASSLCCPSRSEMLTGLTETHTGVDTNAARLLHPTVVEGLRYAGYRTAMAGKYLNSQPCSSPRPEYQLWVCQGTEQSTYSLQDPTLNVNGTWRNHNGIAPDILATYLADFIAATPAKQPFFALYTPTSPHTPADDPRYANLPVTPPRGPAYNEDTKAANKPSYTHIAPFDAALTQTIDHEFVSMSRAVRGLDDSVKLLLDSLGPRADNTLVVYVSDNGYLYGEHRRLSKEVAFEESVNTPLAVRFPTRTPDALEGTVSHALVQNIDLAPTFADEAGFDWNVDGTSLRPLLDGTASTVRDAALLEHCQGRSYPCAATLPVYRGKGFFAPPSFRGVVESRMKYVSYVTGERELYDRATDRYELQNLAGKPEWAAEQARLDAKLAALTAPRPPQTTMLFASTGASGSHQAVRTIKFRFFGSTRDASFACRIARNGAVLATAACNTGTYELGALPDGDYTFSVAAIADGVADPTPESRSFSIAGAGPTFTIAARRSPTRARSGTIAFATAAAVTAVECQLSRNGLGAWKPCSPAAGHTYSNLPDGRWIFRVRGVAGGVRTSPPSEAWFRIDNAGPQATFTDAPAYRAQSQDATVQFVFDERVTGGPSCQLDAAAPVSCAGNTFTASGLTEGAHSLVVTAADALGNVGASTVSWVVDRTAPSLTAIAPSGLVGRNPTVRIDANETTRWMFSLDGGPSFLVNTLPIKLFSLADGAHTLVARGYDVAGNLAAPVTLTWTQAG